ncbi:UNVERIFIED_CONTAM: hypothetical protein Sindi_3121600 [Sesamum indicum]
MCVDQADEGGLGFKDISTLNRRINEARNYVMLSSVTGHPSGFNGSTKAGYGTHQFGLSVNMEVLGDGGKYSGSILFFALSWITKLEMEIDSLFGRTRGITWVHLLSDALEVLAILDLKNQQISVCDFSRRMAMAYHHGL